MTGQVNGVREQASERDPDFQHPAWFGLKKLRLKKDARNFQRKYDQIADRETGNRDVVKRVHFVLRRKAGDN